MTHSNLKAEDITADIIGGTWGLLWLNLESNCQHIELQGFP